MHPPPDHNSLSEGSKPPGFEDDLGPYGPQLFDSYCGEPVGWGFQVMRHLGEPRFDELRMYGNLECAYPKWFLITKTLTRDEAIEEYGPVTVEDVGPRGGWRSVTFGSKKFLSKALRKH